MLNFSIYEHYNYLSFNFNFFRHMQIIYDIVSSSPLFCSIVH